MIRTTVRQRHDRATSFMVVVATLVGMEPFATLPFRSAAFDPCLPGYSSETIISSRSRALASRLRSSGAAATLPNPNTLLRLPGSATSISLCRARVACRCCIRPYARPYARSEINGRLEVRVLRRPRGSECTRVRANITKTVDN